MTSGLPINPAPGDAPPVLCRENSKMKMVKLLLLLTMLFIFPVEASETQTKTQVGWSFYSNALYGFSFRYPNTLAVTPRSAESFHIEGLVFCLDLVDKNRPDIIALRILVSQPSGNPSALKKDFAFLRKVCRKYKELIIDGRKAVNCVTCGRGACSWSIVFPGPIQLEVLTLLTGDTNQIEPKDRIYPLHTIIHSLRFTGPKPESKHVEKAFLDSKENVHIVYSSGEDVQITRDGRCEDLKVDKAQQLVGWVRRGTVEDEKGRVIEEFRAEIVVYQNEHHRKVISGDMTIWNWKFWENGKKIAFCTGPTHGYCFFRLYDLESGHVIDECNKSDSTDCPAWAKDL